MKRASLARCTVSALALIFCGLIAVASTAQGQDGEVVGDNADRRDATLTYYAFHIAKMDARVSFCDGARTAYRNHFEKVVTSSGTAIHDEVMKSYNDRYDTFSAGLEDYSCPENEVSHYRTRLAKQIKNLQRDLAVLE